MKNFILVILNLIMVYLIITGCGSKPQQNCQGQNTIAGVDTTDAADQKCGTEPATPVDTSIEFKGAISGAFMVTVDGQAYNDIEGYYTWLISSLPAQIASLGYAGLTPYLNAQLGFKDLTEGMDVFIAPVSGKGYAGKSMVNFNDQFSFELAATAEGQDYQLRAVKRITLSLKDQDGIEQKRFCFNFSAVDTNVTIAADDLPVVLSDFKSGVTAYDCNIEPSNANGALPVPSAQ